MKITMLGTGGSAGLPQIGGAEGHGDWGQTDPHEPRNCRMRTSIVIETDSGTNILVDTGPDLRVQLIHNAIPRIDAILYTHAHADHIAGFDEIRILNRILNAPMPIYATDAVLAELKQRFSYAFKDWKGEFFGRPVLAPNRLVPGQTITIGGVEILPLDQDHGFSRSLGFRVGNFAYSTDVVRMGDATLDALQGIKTWIVGCFTPVSDHPSHAGLETVKEWARRLQPELTILTHMGPLMDYQTLKATLPSGIEPGYDGMILGI